MKLLDKTSLYHTIDNVNEALFFGEEIDTKEAKEIITFILKTQGSKHAYANGFGMTETDNENRAFTFTGEEITHASKKHIITEEASRVLLKLDAKKVLNTPEYNTATDTLRKGIAREHEYDRPDGMFCCGPCTMAYWRHYMAGGIQEEAEYLDAFFELLQNFRDGKGGWGRFPFYYTLLVLTEMDHPGAKAELDYARPTAKNKLKRLKKSSLFYERRKRLLEMV